MPSICWTIFYRQDLNANWIEWYSKNVVEYSALKSFSEWNLITTNEFKNVHLNVLISIFGCCKRFVFCFFFSYVIYVSWFCSCFELCFLLIYFPNSIWWNFRSKIFNFRSVTEWHNACLKTDGKQDRKR